MNLFLAILLSNFTFLTASASRAAEAAATAAAAALGSSSSLPNSPEHSPTAAGAAAAGALSPSSSSSKKKQRASVAPLPTRLALRITAFSPGGHSGPGTPIVSPPTSPVTRQQTGLFLTASDSPLASTVDPTAVRASPPVTPKTALRVVFSALKLPPPKSPVGDGTKGLSNGSNGSFSGFFNGFQAQFGQRRASGDEYSSRGSSDNDSWRTGDSSSESGSANYYTGRKSLWLFAREHPVRVLAARTVRHPWFDKAVLVLICISSLSLAVDTPLRDPSTPAMHAMRVLDAVLTVLFTLEMALKILPHGLLLPRKSYLRSSWNVLDATVVAVSLAGLILGGSSESSLKSLRSLRALRALRPLRMINRAPGLKVVVSGTDECTTTAH
jgi:Ion transport protein